MHVQPVQVVSALVHTLVHMNVISAREPEKCTCAPESANTLLVPSSSGGDEKTS